MRFSVVHDGVPVGFVELTTGELVAGSLAPVAALEPLRPTIRAGSDALLALGFFGAASGATLNGAGTALRAAADLRFELVDFHGQLAHTSFVNLIEAPDGGIVVITRLSNDHATIPATVSPAPRAEPGHSPLKPDDPDGSAS